MKLIIATLALLAMAGSVMAEPLTVYRFSSETGEYLGTAPAYESPLEPGVFHDPANTTRAVPPEVAEGQIPVWQDGAWAVAEDHRGTIAYKKLDGREVEITEIGPLPDDLTLSPRPSALHLWNNGAWTMDAELKARDEGEKAAAAVDGIDRRSISAIRKALIAIGEGKAVPKDALDALKADEAEAGKLKGQ